MKPSGEIVVGADSCPVGWFVTVLDGVSLKTKTHEQFEDVVATHRDVKRILVDIPIGLPRDQRRRCDIEAKDLLGCRGGSVFFSPSERAARHEDYDCANEAHRQSIGHGLSQQAHAICDKINEVATVVDDRYDGLVRESHPELCFAALNGQPIAYSKSSERGRYLRMHLLSEELTNAVECYRDARNEYLLKEVRRDDIIDSMVLAVSARSEALTMVPPNPSSDEPRIYYPEFDVPAVKVD